MGPPGRAWRISRSRPRRVTFFSRVARGSPVSADEAFRDELRAWLADHPPPVAIEFATTPEEADALREWHRTLHAGRWVGIHWPIEYGGRGAAVTQGAVYNQELARAAPPPLLGRAGVTPVGPTLMAHRTREQLARGTAGILGAHDLRCQ